MSNARYRQAAGSVANLNYHFVWCPKYRRPVLLDAVAERLAVVLHERAAGLGCTVRHLAVLPDHVHLFVAAPPTHAPQHLANQFKGYSSRILRLEFPALRSRLPSLWSRSYYVGAAGAVSEVTIRRYIDAQTGQ
jgi:putative transposase